jgi:hypothetical protein
MIGDNAAAIFLNGSNRMQWLAVAAGLWAAAAFAAPARASDELSLPAPLDDTTLVLMTGGAAAAGQIGATADARVEGLDLTATSSQQASISHSAVHLSGVLSSGNIDVGDVSAAMGGVASLQLSTGFSNIQQNSVALAFVF